MYFPKYSIPLILINIFFMIFIVCFISSIHREQWALKSSVKLDGFLLAIGYLVSAILTPFLLQQTDATPSGQEFLFLIGTCWFAGLLTTLFTIVSRNHLICKKAPHLKQERKYEDFLKKIKFCANEKKRDFSRKALHFIMPPSSILVYFIVHVFDSYFISRGMWQEFGVHYLSIGRGINILIFWSFSYMITLQDIFRLKYFHCLPGWGKTWLSSSMREKEYWTFVASSAFLLGHIPFLLAPFTVFYTISTVASIADAASSLVGLRLGKHKIPWLKRKTIEGVIGGSLAAFICAFIVYLTFNGAQLTTALIFSTSVLIMYGLIDAINEKLNDNFLNTFVLGACIWLIFSLVTK
ncbi:MAG: hypothetical protein ACTSWN_05240 [Promethearchaeota archaeon]